MPVPSPGKVLPKLPETFEIKSAQLSLVALMLKTATLELAGKDLLGQFGPLSEKADFFDQDPLVIDFSQAQTRENCTGMAALMQAIAACKLVAVAARGVPEAWVGRVAEQGLAIVPMEVGRPKPATVSAEQPAVAAVPVAPPVTVREPVAMATMVVDKPLRSGQKIYARGADLIVLAMVNQGAEVVADGNIHVYAPLRGKAMAGARGNVAARIFSLCLEPELVSIAGIYRTSENPLPKEVRGKPAQVRLSNDGQDKLLIEALKT